MTFKDQYLFCYIINGTEVHLDKHKLFCITLTRSWFFPQVCTVHMYMREGRAIMVEHNVRHIYTQCPIP
jgi:hypothetical protein